MCHYNFFSTATFCLQCNQQFSTFCKSLRKTIACLLYYFTLARSFPRDYSWPWKYSSKVLLVFGFVSPLFFPSYTFIVGSNSNISKQQKNLKDYKWSFSNIKALAVFLLKYPEVTWILIQIFINRGRLIKIFRERDGFL